MSTCLSAGNGTRWQSVHVSFNWQEDQVAIWPHVSQLAIGPDGNMSVSLNWQWDRVANCPHVSQLAMGLSCKLFMCLSAGNASKLLWVHVYLILQYDPVAMSPCVSQLAIWPCGNESKCLSAGNESTYLSAGNILEANVSTCLSADHRKRWQCTVCHSSSCLLTTWQLNASLGITNLNFIKSSKMKKMTEYLFSYNPNLRITYMLNIFEWTYDKLLSLVALKIMFFLFFVSVHYTKHVIILEN
jgi:hypothetical protein